MSIEIFEDFELQSFNTFGVNARAKEFVRVASVDDLRQVAEYLSMNPQKTYMVLGGGSDVLFRRDYEGLIIRMEMRGIEPIDENDAYYFVRSAAGEIWHTFVRRTLDAGKPGLENLALIPGTVGGAPVQNIGAYGMEVAEMINSVQVFDLKAGELRELNAEECDFGYRDSIFKRPENHHLLITAVTFAIPKQWTPRIEYKELKAEIENNRPPTLSVEDVFSSVIAIRERKLPNPQKLGNAGSFFKNPIVSKEVFNQISEKYPSVIAYPLAGGRIKLSAAWLIDNAGLRGIRVGFAGTYDKQPLVLVNYGSASGDEVYSLAQEITMLVKSQFGVRLEPEVVIL